MIPSTEVGKDENLGWLQRVKKLVDTTLKPLFLAKYKDNNLKVQINKQDILDLYYNTNKTDTVEEILEQMTRCEGLKTLDTYYKDNIPISVVKLEGTNNVITIEGSDENLSIRKRELYKVKKMVGFYKEKDGDYFGMKVKYLTEKEREKYRLEIINGEFYQDGKTYTSTNYPFDEAIYVMDDKGIFYCNSNYEYGLFHHSSFLGGKPVACAGHIEISNGKLQLIDNKSGHYQPEGEMLDQAINELRKRGVSLENVKVDKI